MDWVVFEWAYAKRAVVVFVRFFTHVLRLEDHLLELGLIDASQEVVVDWQNMAGRTEQLLLLPICNIGDVYATAPSLRSIAIADRALILWLNA